MKITQQIRIGLAAFAFVGIGAAAVELYEVTKPVKHAKAVNQAGLVRGGLQRLAKLELAGQRSDALIETIDANINNLISGGDGLDKAKGEFLVEMKKVKELWGTYQADLAKMRQDPSLQAAFLKDTEEIFEETNLAVDEAEAIFQADATEQRMVIMGVLLIELALVAFMFFTLKNASKQLEKTVSSVTSTSSQITSTVEEQSRIVSDQTASVNETTTTIEELGASSMQAAQQANATATTAQQALDLSENGRVTVQETMDGITNLRSKVGDIAEQIMQLSEQTDQISTVSKLVGDIADQTNMLALNAAVEAARAGEQGKGFAVVAGEIRKLADQSRGSAERIGSLVHTIQSSINSTVMVTDEGNKTADSGIQLAENTLDVFQNIASAINEVSVTAQQIALSSKQQAVGVQQAVSAMNAINLGAKETATVVSQVQSSAEELTNAAEVLQVSV